MTKKIFAVLLCGIFLALASTNLFAQNMVYLEEFEGFGGLLDLTTEDFAGETWFANGFATDNGVLDTGQFEGSATLPFIPEVGNVYNLSVDVTTDTDRWFGLGFSQNASTSVPNRQQDRFAQNGGVAWFLMRPSFPNLAQKVEIFGGLNTDLIILDDDRDFSGGAVLRSMEIVLDTTADLSGATFQADFLIDGSSVSGGIQTIPLELSNIANVGFTVEGPDPALEIGPPVTIDNFLLTQTEGVGGIDGDFDDNGLYNCADVDALTADIAAGNNTLSFDLTDDGAVTTADLDAWLLEAGEENIGPGQAYLLGDADLNGAVDVSDFNIWNGSKFTNVDAWCQADFNADGVADVGDFNIWNGNKFTSSDTVAVPEPDSFLVLLGAVSMLALSCRKRR